MQSCTRQKHGLVNGVRETGTDKELLVYETNKGIRMGRGGTGLVAAHKETTRQGRKGSKSNVRRNSLEADALEHLYDEAHIITLLNPNSLPVSIECMLTEAAIGCRFHSGRSRRSGREAQAMSRWLSDPEG